MPDLQAAIDAGHYAQEQIHSRDPLIAWSHRRRFHMALALGRQFAGRRVLDYGCGDGTFLGLLVAGPTPPALAVGADINRGVVADCQRRFAGHPTLQFCSVADLVADEARRCAPATRPHHARRGATGSSTRSGRLGVFDGVFCMEVLEHVVDPLPVLGALERLLAPGGTLVISVPIEIGLPLLVKQAVRCVAGWRGVGHYPGTTDYTLRELAAGVCASSTQSVERPVFHRDDETFHDHKGFNWRLLRDLVKARFDLVSSATSPVAWLGPQLSTQIWFVARGRAA